MIHQNDSDVFNQIQEWIIEYKTTDNEKIKEELKKLITIAAMPFVKRIAIGLARRSTDPVDDLIQSGALGLMKALELYDAKPESRFKSYATYLITGEIKHYLRDKASVLKPPRDIQELSSRINSLLKGVNLDGSDISAEKIADALSVPVKKINEVFEVDRRKKILSLDEIVIKDDECFVPLVEKIPAGDYKYILDMYEAKIMLKDAIDRLDDRLKDTISMIYYQDMTQKQVAQVLNISQMQVSRRLRQAFDELYKVIKQEKGKS